MKLPVITAQQIETFILVFLRVSAMVAAIPVFGDSAVPVRIKGALSCLISFLLFPLVPSPPPLTSDFPPLILGMAGEVLIGFIIGFAARLVFAGIQFAGELIGFQMGFSIVNIIDPITSTEVSIISQFYKKTR